MKHWILSLLTTKGRIQRVVGAGVTLVRDRRGRHWSALLWRNAVGFLTQRPQFEEYRLAQAYLRPGQSVGRRLPRCSGTRIQSSPGGSAGY